MMEGFGLKPTIEKKEGGIDQVVEKGIESLGENMGIDVAGKMNNLSPEKKKSFFTNLISEVSDAWEKRNKENFEKWREKNSANIMPKDGIRWEETTKKSDFLDRRSF